MLDAIAEVLDGTLDEEPGGRLVRRQVVVPFDP
jgi:hypothetical protein